MRAFAFLAVLAAAPCALADFVGRVVHVSDGDTLTVLVDRKPVRVRLDSIDAPELGQPFGKRSQQSLAELCGTKTAHVVEKGLDRYGRTIGWIVCGEVDANAEQVRRGMAWVFVRYAPADSPLYALQGDARWTRRGLWVDPQPIAPWDWRAKSREESSGPLRRPAYRG